MSCDEMLCDRKLGEAIGRGRERDRVERFHTNVIGLTHSGHPHLEPDECMARARLIAEEACETVAALIGGRSAELLWERMATRMRLRDTSLVEYVDGAADLRVVLHGADLRLGVWSVANQAFDLVMDANDAKAGGPKDPTTGKQLKPPGWTPPDIAGLLKRELGWEE